MVVVVGVIKITAQHSEDTLGDAAGLEPITGTYLAAVRELEEEVQDAVGDARAKGVLQVHLVALQHQVGVLCAPVEQHPHQVILNHRDGRVRNVLLFLRQTGVDVLLEALRQVLDNNRRVCDLLTV